MKRAILLLVAGTLLKAVAAHASAAGSIAGALPHGARLVAAVSIPGYPGARAVAFDSAGHYVGLLLGGAHPRLTWRDRLQGQIRYLQAPGPSGVFAGLTGSGRSQQLFAFRWSGKSVATALAGSRAGLTPADEGATVRAASATVIHADRAHVGSVHYRITARYAWSAGLYRVVSTVRAPDYPANQYPGPAAVAHSAGGDVILLRLEVADTPDKRETGLMFRKSLDPDTGMIFVWSEDTVDGFWMENTYVPLTVAFVAADGTILQLEDMAPLTTTVHAAHHPYRFAIEVNQGFFEANHIIVGDRLDLRLH